MAAGFWEELSMLGDATEMPSYSFLREATRLQETKHQNALMDLLKKYKLTANIPMTMLDIGKAKHPVLKPSDFISALSQERKLELLLCNHTGIDYQDFWHHWRLLQSDHPVFVHHSRRLRSCIPIWLFADEGTSIKKKAILILQYQPILGWGSKRADDVNMRGVSTTTRFLFSVMSGKVYAGKKKKQEPLHDLVTAFATEIGSCFDTPIDVQGVPWTKKLYLVCLGLKGDLAALVKLGKLTRNYMRDTATGIGPGICHLCKAGQEGCGWDETDFLPMQRMKTNVPTPWHQEPSLISLIPVSPSKKAEFFRLDVFHILLKGVFGDICANAIVSCKQSTEKLCIVVF